MRPLYLLTVSILLLPLIANAQAQAQSWENLRTLRVGDKIQVVDQTLKSQDGRFRSVSDDAITFHVEQQELAIQRADVLRVSSREHLGRGKKALIGLGIGAGACVIAGAIINESQKEKFIRLPRETMAVTVVLGGAIGAAVGALLPSEHPTLYRAEPRRNQGAP